jgi:hypothetical protein
MKVVLTLVLVIFIGFNTVAQNTESNEKVTTIQTDVVLTTSSDTPSILENVETSKEQSVARLYRYQNSRVKKALSFRTKKDRPKLA